MKLSVALCTYNGEAYLPAQLESFSRQTRLPDELVVVDDASTDTTPYILTAFAERSPFPVRLHVGPRVGPARNFARAVARCRGELIALSDQDDRWMPDRLALAEEAITGPAGAVMSFSDASLIDPEGRPSKRRLWKAIGLDRKHLEAIPDDPLAVLLRRPIVTGCTMTFHRSVLDLGLPFPPTPTLDHDRWLALCAAATGTLAPIPEPLVAYRIHPGQHTGVGRTTRRGRPPRRLLANVRRARRPDGRVRVEIRDQAALLRTRIERLHPSDIDSLDTLDEYLAFFDLRERLLTESRRLPVVLSQALAGNYRRFAAGWMTAAADIVRR